MNVIFQNKTSTIKTCSDVGVPFSFKYKELNYDAMIVYDFLKFAWLEQCVFETLNLNVYRLDMQTEQANTIFSKMEKPDKPLKFHFLGSFRLQYRR